MKLTTHSWRNPALLRSLSCYFATCFYRSHESFIKSCVSSFSLKLVALALCSTFVLCSGMLFKGLRRSLLDKTTAESPQKPSALKLNYSKIKLSVMLPWLLLLSCLIFICSPLAPFLIYFILFVYLFTFFLLFLTCYCKCCL